MAKSGKQPLSVKASYLRKTAKRMAAFLKKPKKGVSAPPKGKKPKP